VKEGGEGSLLHEGASRGGREEQNPPVASKKKGGGKVILPQAPEGREETNALPKEGISARLGEEKRKRHSPFPPTEEGGRVVLLTIF